MGRAGGKRPGTHATEREKNLGLSVREDRMNPEFLELAHEAVAALQSAPPPTWVEIAALAEPGV